MVRRSLIDAIAWCAPRARASLDDPIYSLRTPSLRPDGYEFRQYDSSWGGYRNLEPSLHHESVSKLRSIVDTLVVARSELLYQGQDDGRVLGNSSTQGRLLVCQLYSTLFDGASEAESKGFFDVDDVPPWDTWIWFGALEMTGRENYASSDYDYHLLSWVPSPLVELVEEGIAVNAFGVLAWAKDIDSNFTDRLRAANLLQ